MTEPPAIGSPVARKDGRAKVTGAALYAFDRRPDGAMAYADLVTSRIALGRVRSIDSSEAEAMPGVRLVLTHLNMTKLGPVKPFTRGGQAQSGFVPLQSDEVKYHGQILAVVVADTPDAAADAAGAVRVEYEPARGVGVASIQDPRARAKPFAGFEAPRLGDADGALTRAPVKVDETYETPIQHHNPIELYATVADREGDALTVYEPSQWVSGLRAGLAAALGLDQAKVRVVSPYVGGGFGCKATMLPHTAMIAEASRRLGRPVRFRAGRGEMFTIGSFRPGTRQRVALGADRSGRLLAYVHETSGQTSRSDELALPGPEVTTRMYACPDVRTAENVVPTDVNTPGFMRAPSETPTMFALESAIDELAAKLGMDPVLLRRVNEPDRDPIEGVPYSSRELVRCFERGAEAFGWSRRDPRPGSMRAPDGGLVGWGCAASIYPTYIGPAQVRLALRPDGRAIVRTGAHDIGTGTYTTLAQMAADAIGLPVGRVGVELGDSAMPYGSMAAGSRSTASLAGAVADAGARIKALLRSGAAADRASPLHGLGPGGIELAGGRLFAAADTSRGETVEAFLRRQGGGPLEVEGAYAPRGMEKLKVEAIYRGDGSAIGPVGPRHAIFAYGAQFVEVRVNPRTREIRVPRMVGVFEAGRIVNPRTARSQLMGAMVMGLGSALHERTLVDERVGQFLNRNLAEYMLPVNADFPSVTVETLDASDPVTPLGAKGLGELGIVGTAAAVANAVFHATGVRVRELPITLEKIMA